MNSLYFMFNVSLFYMPNYLSIHPTCHPNVVSHPLICSSKHPPGYPDMHLTVLLFARTLRHLHLSNTRIQSQGRIKLTNALKVNSVLLSVGLSETTGGVGDLLAVEGLLMKNHELKKLKEDLERVKRERDEALDKLRRLGYSQ